MFYENYYDHWGFRRVHEKVRNEMGIDKFDKLSKKKQQKLIELEYLAELLVRIYLAQEEEN